MKHVKIGLIGVGVIGQVHARVLSTSPWAELVGIAEIDDERREKWSKDLGVPGYADYRELLMAPGLEAVSICTPDHYHLKPTMDCMDADLHILLEKPLTTDLAEAQQIATRVRRYGKKFMVAYIVRFDSRYALAKEVVDRGEIGEIIHMTAMRNAKPWAPRYLKGRVSLPWFLGVHDLDQLMWFAGSEVERVHAEQRHLLLKEEVGVEDTVLILLRFKNGIIAQLNLCWACPAKAEGLLRAGLDIVWTKGQVTVELWDHGLKVITEEGVRLQDATYGPFLHGERMGRMVLQLDHFLKCILEDRTPLVGVEEGLAGVRAVTAINESLRTGQVVRL